jgi:hypothetical protein
MLSSLSCILGWASQSNFAAVKGVGYVAESRDVSDRMHKATQFLMLPDDAVLRAIGAVVLHPFDQAQILLGLNSGPGAQWNLTNESHMGRDARFLPLKYRRPTGSQATGQQLGDCADADAKSLSARLQEAGSHDEATCLVGDAITAKLGDIFMIPTDDIDLAKPPAQYGVDSLVAVELRNMLMLQAASDVSL